LPVADSDWSIPSTMHAAVYRGQSVVSVEEVPTPEIGPGEILVRVEACGICHTDLKKIEHNLLAPPRIYGHETAGIVVGIGSQVRKFAPGDRVVVFHHIPCGTCFYCSRKLYAQCPIYKKVGVTAGFEPAGGGFSQYVKAMDWIVERGVEKIPDDVSFERASFVEPVNTCLKAVVQCAAQPGEVAIVIGQGPIGLLFTMLLRRTGATIVATDTIGARRELSRECGAQEVWDPRETNVEAEVRRLTEQRGADLVIVAASVPGIVEQAIRLSRPGAFFCLRRRPKPSAWSFPAPRFAWVNALCSGVTARPWIYRKNRQIWFSAAHCLWKNSSPTGCRLLKSVQDSIWRCIPVLNR
jgi:L-iditol 2-dehydrogenase